MSHDIPANAPGDRHQLVVPPLNKTIGKVHWMRELCLLSMGIINVLNVENFMP
jgi:hypothetical protein